MSKGENIFQRKDGRRAARCSKGYELPAVPPVRLLLRRVAARKADGGVRREKRPAPMFSTGAGRFFTEGRNPRYAESAEWAGFPRAYFGRSRAPPLRGRSGYSVGTGIPRLYPAGQSRARRGAFGAPVGAGLCSALRDGALLRPFYPRVSGLPSSSAAVSSSPR